MKKKERETLAQQGAGGARARRRSELQRGELDSCACSRPPGSWRTPAALRVLRRDLARVKTFRRALELKGEAG